MGLMLQLLDSNSEAEDLLLCEENGELCSERRLCHRLHSHRHIHPLYDLVRFLLSSVYLLIQLLNQVVGSGILLLFCLCGVCLMKCLSEFQCK